MMDVQCKQTETADAAEMDDTVRLLNEIASREYRMAKVADWCLQDFVDRDDGGFALRRIAKLVLRWPRYRGRPVAAFTAIWWWLDGREGGGECAVESVAGAFWAELFGYNQYTKSWDANSVGEHQPRETEDSND